MLGEMPRFAWLAIKLASATLCQCANGIVAVRDRQLRATGCDGVYAVSLLNQPMWLTIWRARMINDSVEQGLSLRGAFEVIENARALNASAAAIGTAMIAAAMAAAQSSDENGVKAIFACANGVVYPTPSQEESAKVYCLSAVCWAVKYACTRLIDGENADHLIAQAETRLERSRSMAVNDRSTH